MANPSPVISIVRSVQVVAKQGWERIVKVASQFDAKSLRLIRAMWKQQPHQDWAYPLKRQATFG